MVVIKENQSKYFSFNNKEAREIIWDGARLYYLTWEWINKPTVRRFLRIIEEELAKPRSDSDIKDLNQKRFFVQTKLCGRFQLYKHKPYTKIRTRICNYTYKPPYNSVMRMKEDQEKEKKRKKIEIIG